MGRRSRLKKERRESNRRERTNFGLGVGDLAWIDFSDETVFETLKGEGSTPLPAGEFDRIRDAMAKAEPWFHEMSVAYGRPNAPYRPSVQIFGSRNAWRWILDIRTRAEAKAAPNMPETIAECLGQFGNAGFRRVIEADSSETFLIGAEVVSRANKAGAELLPLPTDEDLGIKRVPDGVHCTCCSAVFSRSGDTESTGLCESCREDHGPATVAGSPGQG